ncbi:hypothetical protein QJS66_21145 [Kocuria rhizophila]|nr:hypothetical protein QJS66_21145 [Kocuria rhizophila]
MPGAVIAAAALALGWVLTAADPTPSSPQLPPQIPQTAPMTFAARCARPGPRRAPRLPRATTSAAPASAHDDAPCSRGTPCTLGTRGRRAVPHRRYVPGWCRGSGSAGGASAASASCGQAADGRRVAASPRLRGRSPRASSASTGRPRTRPGPPPHHSPRGALRRAARWPC